MKQNYSPETLYRLPWNFADNSISWLEPTSKCNLYCDGCYRENRNSSHKSLDEIAHELDVFQRNRKTDGVSIAGGEPLTHPNIIEIVKMVKERGWKPLINSNGALLTKELTKELRKAGLFGFTLHVDSGQRRKGWESASEIDLLDLRYEMAKMIADVGCLSCSFNMTVYPETLEHVPKLTQWAQENIDIVHVMVFIIYRMAIHNKHFDYYAQGKKVEFHDMWYSKEEDERKVDIMSPDVVDEIRKVYPDFMPSAFLNGTIKPDTYKWLLTGRLGNKHEIFGYLGPKFMEIVQAMNHIFTGSYLAYSTPFVQRLGLLYSLIGLFDKEGRKAFANYFRAFPKNLKAFFSPIHYQSVMIIQPADIYKNGSQNMCDGCPDITVWNDQLVWSCRMEEQNRWGENVVMFPKEKVNGH
jgi:MoaA/NifB/PqqE/SkfB family radical SAM enzyme